MSQNSNQYLAQEKIGKLLIKFSVPCILSLLVSSLYNIVDQIFIGRGVGYLGNGATNVVFPITIITLAIALMIGDGAAAFLSICQGKKDTDNAHKSIGNAIVLIIATGILATIFFFVVKEPILRAFGATENNIAYAREYFNYIVLGLPFYMFGIAANSMIRADGSPQISMIATLAGCVVNIILDPITIFVLGWGMTGAALATVVGQVVTAVVAGIYLARTKTFKLEKSSFVIKFDVMKRFLPLGISSLFTQLSIVAVAIVMNTTLVKYGAISKYGEDIPLTVFGIVIKVYQIVIAIIVGIAVGAQPIVGYNYGAREYGRVKKIYTTMMKAEIITGILAFIAFEFFPLQIIKIFGSENGLYNEFAVLAFRIYLCTIIFACVQKATSIFLQSIGKPVMAMSVSLIRDFVVSIPLVLILPRYFGVVGALFSAPIADIISLILVITFMVIIFKKLDQTQLEA